MTVKETSARFGLSVRTIQRYCEGNLIECTKTTVKNRSIYTVADNVKMPYLLPQRPKNTSLMCAHVLCAYWEKASVVAANMKMTDEELSDILDLLLENGLLEKRDKGNPLVAPLACRITNKGSEIAAANTAKERIKKSLKYFSETVLVPIASGVISAQVTM